MHCSQLISCTTATGSTTSAMLKHMSSYKMLQPKVSDAEVDGRNLKHSNLHHQSIIDGISGSKVPSFLAFSQPATRKSLVEMVIMDELPFRFVEPKGFKRFMSVAQPRFDIPCRKTVAKDCLVVFEEERSKL